MKKNFIPVFFVLLLGLIATASHAQTMRVRPISHETTLERAHLVVEAIVTDVQRLPRGDGLGGHALITLGVRDVLKGNVGDELTMRRFQLNPDGSYQYPELVPVYEQGDHIVVSVYEGVRGYYKPLGLYNGAFYIDDGQVRGTDVSLGELKAQIAETLAVERSGLDASLKSASEYAARVHGSSNPLSAKAMYDIHNHFGGRLRTSTDETWEPEYYTTPGIVIKYLDGGRPGGLQSSKDNAEDRIGAAVSAWDDIPKTGVELQYGGLSEEAAPTGFGELPQVSDSSDNVIWWDDANAGGDLGKEWRGPTLPAVGTKNNSDIWLNLDPGPCQVWYFGDSATAYPDRTTTNWQGCSHRDRMGFSGGRDA